MKIEQYQNRARWEEGRLKEVSSSFTASRATTLHMVMDDNFLKLLITKFTITFISYRKSAEFTFS